MLDYEGLREIADRHGEQEAKLMYPDDDPRQKREARRIADREYYRMTTPPRYYRPLF